MVTSTRILTAELYADFMSALLNDPDWTMRTAPQMTHAFFAALSEVYSWKRSTTSCKSC